MRTGRSTRRMFLLGAGGAALTVPFLPSLLKSKLEAQPAPRLKYVIVSSNYCADLIGALPFESDHVPFGTVTQLDDATRRQSLDEIVQKRGYLTPVLQGAAWDRLRPYMNIVMGSAINGANDKHNSCSTTAASMPHDVLMNGLPANDNPFFKYSADYLAERLLKTSSHAYGALRFNLTYRHGMDYGFPLGEYQNYGFGGPRSDDPSYADVLPTMRDAAELEQKLGSLGGQQSDPSVAKRKKLIDAVREDYQGVMSSARISRNDRNRLQEAVDLWNDAESRLSRASACGAPTLMNVTGSERADFRAYHEYAMDLCVYALACDVTPVVNYALLQTSDAGPMDSDGWFQLHANTHEGSTGGLMGAAFEWRAARMAYLGTKLLDTKDADGAPLLDSTMLMWGHEYTFPGAHPNSGHWNMFLGKAGGRIDTGHYLDLSGDGLPDQPHIYQNCAPYNRLLLTTLMAIGHTPATIEAITGQVGFGEYGDLYSYSNDHRKGATAGWGNENRAKFFTDAEKRKPLPILKKV